MKLRPNRKYFFGYLFVRLAKTIAGLIVLLGCVFIVFRYAQAHNAANAVAYRPSVALDQKLERLSVTYTRTAGLVSAFNPAGQAGKFSTPQFDRRIRSDAAFERLHRQLAGIGQDQTRMKQLVVQRLESALTVIEQRLRAHAASLQAAASPPPAPAVATPSPSATATPAPASQEQQETLYSSQLGKSEIESRLSRLESAKAFLADLEAKAENLENRKSLFDSITELEALKKLLPVSIDRVTRPQATPTPTPSSTSPEPAKVTQARALARAEEVANQLGVYRQTVREAVLSSWALDEAYEDASEVAGSESNKCQASSLVENGIWLSAFGQMAMAIIAALFLAFLILVMADLTQTLLDTATNTGVMADATQRPS